jgi:hypothetical protein
MSHLASSLRDRRFRRSQHFSTALRYQLEHTLRRGRMAALALTDHAGVLLAWAGEDGLAEELGAVAPVVAHGWPPELEAARLPKTDVTVRPIECFGEQLYLASLGGGVARDALLSHSARGIHRILTAN